MAGKPDLPDGIGPHEGRELELMLLGEKPLAMFVDVIPSAFAWPDDQFEPYVSAGQLVKREYLTNSHLRGYKERHLYFALPDEVWRINEAHELSQLHFGALSDESIEACAELGRLLGYQETDITAFRLWSEKIRATQA